MHVHFAAAFGMIVAIVLSACGPAAAQPPATDADRKQPDAAPAAQPHPPAPADGAEGRSAADLVKNMPPSQKLGLRAAMVRAKLPVNPIVVIVPDGRSYIAAIERWNYDAGVRFPVLMDDGSWRAQQAIARFVRAYRPKSVVRWLAPPAGGAPAWPGDAAARHVRLERAAARPWLVGEVPAEGSLADALKAQWAKLQFVPPGLIVASSEDPAWPAALALAAGRGQPLAWLIAPGKADGYMSVENAADLEKRIEAAAEASGRSWSGLGDDLDAVTICLNCAAKVYLGEKEQNAMLALTDWIGRKAGGGPEDRPSKERWAWTGQIIGSEWQAAYGAMCSLFLVTDSAWLFDGYDSSPPWSLYDATEAAAVLEQVQIKCTVDDEADRSIAAWRRRAAGVSGRGTTGGMGVNAGLVMVNSSGNPDFFNLKPGEGKPDDAPILHRPAIVHFVHSWSASVPTDVNTVAGAWIERGAYAYVGAVHEPYLQAFVPTPKLAMRLAAGLPLGAAARLDDGEVWKINVLGDPLTTLGPTGPVVAREPDLPGAVDLQQDLSAAIKGDGPRDYRRALTDLLLMGRDKDGAELLAAVLSQDRDKLTPDAALAGLTCAFVAGDLNTFIDAYNIAQPRLAGEEAVARDGLWDARDMLWHALWPTLGTLNRERAQLLSLNLRAQTLARDAGEAYSAIANAVNKGAAHDVVARALRLARNDAERRQIEQIEK